MNKDTSTHQAPQNAGSSTHSPLEDHLIELGNGWSLWRTACLRGAGFEANRLDSLVATDTDTALENLFAAESNSKQAFTCARDLCWSRIRSHQGDERRPWRRILRRLDKGTIPAEVPADEELEPLLAAAAESVAAVESGRQAFNAAFECAALETGRALRAAAAESRLREAVIWQNRHAVKTGFDHLLRQPGERRDSQVRQHELLVARYLQRYCSTNESIGFFGPVGWCDFSETGPAVVLHPGPALLAERQVRFEYWVIDALAEVLLAYPGLRAELPPRLAPGMRIEANLLRGSLGRRTKLEAGQLALLRRLDGTAKAGDLAASLGADVKPLLALLERLARAGVIVWRLPIPVGEHPERDLQACLDRIVDTQVRARCCAPLQRLVTAREKITKAAGDPEHLDIAMANLESEFKALTGGASRRHEGQAYAGRALVYEDCRRDISLSLGPDLLAQLGPPLVLILQSARWFSWQLAGQYLEFVTATLQQCQREARSSVVDLEHLWVRLQAKTEMLHLIVDDVAEQVQQRWTSILFESVDTHNIQLSVNAIREQVNATFDAPQPGWPGARYHSPDVLIAADSAQAIRAGHYQLVLGEVHTGGNSLSQNVFLSLHPQPQELLRALEIDTPEPELVAVYPRGRRGHRMVHDPHTAKDFHMAFDDSASWRQPEQVLPISALVVEDTKDGLIIRSRDHSRRFPAIAFFGPQLCGLSVNRFGILGSQPHTPRVTIDRLVVCRESWRFALSSLAIVNLHSAPARYAAVRRWANTHGLPRRIFVRVPGEKKPAYVDFKSPVSVDLLVKMVRGAAGKEGAELSVSEMLPTPEQAWLTDTDGRRYTSELRVAALDSLRWRAL